ncbi:ATP-binding protein [Shewanella sp. AS16]|uniref:ATP-binding protein n=1 Tax=Shewanella sp. AS16 TaxID=2907625 RepID=UPI001F440625|nr:ATP-binding protein [Shewanella sp. AS16]MCE9684920.1 ATP-binding protein [Shewanella sp. AS16]
MPAFCTKISIGFLLAFCCLCHADDQYDPGLFSPTLFTAEADGRLANKEILKLAQDDRGFIWVGTQRGLFRFDGYENRKMTSEGMPFDVSAIYVRSLLADGDVLWIGTLSSGLLRLDLRTYQFSQFSKDQDNPVSLGGNQVNAIKKDAQGKLWLAHSFGLDRLDPATQTFRHFVSADDTKDRYFNYLLDLEADSDGSLWLSTAKGLAKLAPGAQQFALIREPALLAEVVIRRIHLAKDGRIWLATQKQGTFILNRDSQTAIKLESPASRADAANTAIVETDDGQMWLSGSLGLEIRDAVTGRLQKELRGNLLDKYGLRGDVAYPLLKSKDGLIWIGVSNFGLQFFNPQTRRFHYFDRFSPQLANTFGSYLANLLKVSESKLIIFNQHQPIELDLTTGKTAPLLKEPSLAKQSFFSGIRETDDIYWLGGGNGNIFRVDRSQRTAEEFRLPLTKTEGVYVRHLALGKQGELWVGSDRGLLKLDLHSRSFSFPKHSDGSPFITYVRRLMVDDSNRLWVGSTSGLGLVDSGQTRVQFYSREQGTAGTLRHNTIVQFLQNRRGEVLVYHKGGIDKLVSRQDDTMRFAPFATEVTDKLENEETLLQLENGQYWLGSHFLLDEDGRLLQALTETDGALDTGQGKNFLRLNHSQLLHASRDALVLIDQDAGIRGHYRAPLVVTELMIGNQEVNFDDTTPSIRVPSSANQFSLRFAALDFSEPRANQYRYKLDGYDPEWITTPADVRQANYTALPPGHYRLFVEGSNREGDWSGAPLILAVDIEPKFFQTQWFRLLALLLLALLLYWLFRWRLAVAKSKQKEIFEKREALRKAEMMTELMEQKNQMLAEVTHDLRTPLAMVKLQLEALQDGVLQPSEKSYETLQQRITGLNHLVGDIYQLSLMESGALTLHRQTTPINALLASTVDAFRPMMQQKDLRLTWHDDTPHPVELLIDEGRITQVLNNLMKNSFRYTDEHGQVRVTLTQDSARVTIRVEDSKPSISDEELGKVFERLYRAKSTRSKSQSGSGLGLWICKSITEAHDGEISAGASVLGGLAITIRLPL